MTASPLLSLALAGGCARGPAVPPVDWSADLLRTSLSVDVAAKTGTATVEFTPSEAGGLSLEACGLAIERVVAGEEEIDWVLQDGALHMAVPKGVSLVGIDYAYAETDGFDGANEMGFTLTWPDFCGNVFPCRSAPSDGLVLDLAVTGVPQGEVAVHADTSTSDAPSYQLAWTVGPYAWVELGTTPAGTRVGAWVLPGDEAAVASGTDTLLAGFAWYEKTLGSYAFGPVAGSVSVDWGPYTGGMEHHPYWYVSRMVASTDEIHLHEAAHGWFGNGVRLRCWEDFVMSEGTATYLAARALGAVAGPEAEEGLWAEYDAKLRNAVSTDDHPAWPGTCGEVDVDEELLDWIPYMKGAFFYRAVEREVGRSALDGALAAFYRAHVGRAAGMQDVLDTIGSETGFDPTPLANAWLRGLGIPE